MREIYIQVCVGVTNLRERVISLIALVQNGVSGGADVRESCSKLLLLLLAVASVCGGWMENPRGRKHFLAGAVLSSQPTGYVCVWGYRGRRSGDVFFYFYFLSMDGGWRARRRRHSSDVMSVMVAGTRGW